MGVDVSHLVAETLGDTDDQVVDERADSSECGDVLAGSVVKLNVDLVLLWVGECDRQMAQVLCELATGSLDGDIAGLDRDLDCEASSISILWFVGVPSSAISSSAAISTILSNIEVLHCHFSCAISCKGVRTALWDVQRFLGVDVPHGCGGSG